MTPGGGSVAAPGGPESVAWSGLGGDELVAAAGPGVVAAVGYALTDAQAARPGERVGRLLRLALAGEPGAPRIGGYHYGPHDR